MSHYAAGRRAEYRAQRILETAGYETARMAGSHGHADVIAWDTQEIRFIQVKKGTARMTPADREAFLLMPAPACGTREYWRFPNRKPPIIEVL